jgi:hypothetical protein
MPLQIKDYSTGNEPEGESWDTEEAQQLFTFHGFMAPYVVVTRKSDGVKGSLEFSHSPRRYFNFVPE